MKFGDFRRNFGQVVPAALEHVDPETVVVQPSDVGKTPETVTIAISLKSNLI